MTERKASTEAHWPTETSEQVIERTRAEHGDKAAEVVRRAIFGDLPKANVRHGAPMPNGKWGSRKRKGQAHGPVIGLHNRRGGAT